MNEVYSPRRGRGQPAARRDDRRRRSRRGAKVEIEAIAWPRGGPLACSALGRLWTHPSPAGRVRERA